MKVRSIIRTTTIIAAALAALTIETRALPPHAEPSAQTERKTPDTTISVETALVNLDVLVTDQDGLVLEGLNLCVTASDESPSHRHFESQ